MGLRLLLSCDRKKCNTGIWREGVLDSDGLIKEAKESGWLLSVELQMWLCPDCLMLVKEEIDEAIIE